MRHSRFLSAVRMSVAGSVMAVAMLGISTAAHAEAADAADAQAKPANSEVSAGEIIVTAQKTAQSADKVAQAISVFTGQALISQGVTNVTGLGQYTPGLEVLWNSRGPQLNIRGIEQTDATSKGESDIIFTIDGIYQARPQQFGSSFYDIDRVEVLKGPQGTLYGISATGGAINVITKAPTNELGAGATVELGTYNARRFQGYFNLPVTSNFAIRAAFNANNVDGFIKPILGNSSGAYNAPAQGGEDNWSGRITAKLDFGSNGSWLTTLTVGHIGGPAPSNSILCGDQCNAANTTGFVIPLHFANSGSQRFDVYDNPFGGAGGLDDKYVNLNTTVNADLSDAVHATLVGSHYWWHGNDIGYNTNNQPGTSYNWGDYENNETTNSLEFRLSNAKSDARLEWLVGASYWRDYNDERDIEWQISDTPVSVYHNGTLAYTSDCAANFGAPGCASPNPQIVGPNVHASEGVFGQLSYHATSKLKLTAGLRYSWDKSARYSLFSAGPIFGPDAWASAPPGTGGPIGLWLNSAGTPCYSSNAANPAGWCVNPAQSFNDTGVNNTKALTYKLAAEYQVALGQMFYAQVATGYKGGGFNDYDAAASAAAGRIETGLYGDERVTAYEVGFKGRLSPTLHVTTDAYYYDFPRFQNTGAILIPQSASGVIIDTTVVPITSYGWEGELNWRPTSLDSFNATLTLEKAFYDHGPNQLQAGFLSFALTPWGGHELTAVPRVATTLSYDHRFPLNSGAYIKFHISSKISDKYYVESVGSNPPGEYIQPAYTRSDASLSFNNESGKISVEAFVKNIENGIQAISVPGGGQITTISVTQPRTAGVRLTAKF